MLGGRIKLDGERMESVIEILCCREASLSRWTSEQRLEGGERVNYKDVWGWGSMQRP